MATTVRVQRRILVPSRQPHQQSARNRRWPLVIAVTLGLGLGALWLAPVLIAHSPLRNRLLAWACVDLKGTATTEGATLGWFSPITVHHTDVRDEQGNPLVHIPKVTSEKTLLALLGDLSNLGRFRLEHPEIHLTLHQQGSNVEEALAELLQPSDEPSGQRVGIALEIVGGSVSINDLPSARRWEVEQLSVRLNIPSGPGAPLQLQTSGQVTQTLAAAQSPRVGKFSLSANVQGASAPGKPEANSGQAILHAEAFPLALIQPILRRVEPAAQLEGRLHANVSCRWNPESGDASTIEAGQTLEGRITAEQLRFTAPWLGADQVHLEQLDLPCKIVHRQNQLHVQRLDLSCDVGHLDCTATLPDTNHVLAAETTQAIVAAVSRATGRVKGQLDLARLAKVLPNTMHLREGTQLTSGELKLDLASQPDADGARWEGRLDTTRLAAMHQGRDITWERPFSVVLAARQTLGGLLIERLDAESEFLRVEGSGTSDRFALAAAFDLTRLADQLSQLVDLGGLRMAGDGSIQLNWNRGPTGQFAADGQVRVNRFELAAPGTTPWLEQQLELSASAAGMVDGSEPRRLDSAELTLTSGSDKLTAQLVRPVLDFGKDYSLAASVAAQGELATWLPRIDPWLVLPAGWNFQGSAEATARVVYSPQSIEIEQAQIALQQFRAWGHGLFIGEPRLNLAMSGRWSPKQRRFEIDQATIESAALGAKLTEAAVVLGEETSPEANGKLSFEGDLNRLQRWVQDPAAAATWTLAGRFRGKADVDSSGGDTAMNIDTLVDHLAVVSGTGQQWQEAQVRLVGRGHYRPAADTLGWQQLQLHSAMAQLRLEGQVSQLSAQRMLDCRGRVDYDLEKITRFLQLYTGPGLQLSGRESRSFWVSGPLAPVDADDSAGTGTLRLEKLDAHAEFGWQAANLFGLHVGSTTLETQLANGLVWMKPVEIAVGQGRLRLAPQLRLAPGPAQLVVEPGLVADRINITPQMCNQALMYVAPVLAGATRAEGQFSVAMEGCRVPLGEPKKMDAAGRLTVHSIEIGPGPLVQEMAILLGTPAPAKLTRESEVGFRVADGRIYHQGLELVFPELTVRTYGSVGFDQTLALMAEMPVPPKWIGNNPLGAALKGQIIRLPIGGTLQRPKLDQQALDQVASRFIRNAAEGAIRRELDNQLDRFFGPLPGRPR